MKNRLLIWVIFVVVVTFGINYLDVPPSQGSEQGPVRALSIVNSIGYKELVHNVTFYTVKCVVQNNYKINIRSINVTATFYDASNNTIDECVTYTRIRIVKPENRAPFEIYLSLVSIPPPDHYCLRALGVETDEEPIAALEIVDQTYRVDDEGYPNIAGEVENKGNMKAISVVVTCAFYDAEDNLIDICHDFASPLSIGPGGKAHFELSLKRTINPSKFELFVTANRYERLFRANWVLLSALIAASVLFVAYMKRRGW